MVNKGRSLPGVDSFVGDIGAFAGPLILLVLSLLLLVVPAEAQPAFGMSDLAGIWRLHILTGSAAVDVPGSTLRGTIELDATGALVTGALDHADGSTTSLAGGTFTISSLGLVLGSLSAADLGDAEITEARMLFDRQVILGVISGGDPGTIAGADYGLVTLVKVSAGFADDLVATWRYHELRTSDTAGQPPTSVVGEAVFDTATIAGGALITPDSLSGTPAGVQLTTADGGFTASVSGVGAAWQVTGQVAASADFIAGTTKVGGGAAAGLALASRVGGGASVATSHLAGAWTIYVVALDGAHGNHGTFLRGALLIDAGGGLVSGTIADAPDGAELTLNSGLLAVDSTTARVTGTLTAATAQTFALDATLRGSADLVSGLLTVGGTAPAALGLLVMVRDVSLVGFDAATYRVAEGGAATVTIVRSGDVTQASTLSLRAHGARFGDQVLALTFSAGATTRSVSIPTVEDGIFGVETVTLELTGLPAGVLLGPLGTATLTIADDEEAGSFRFGAPAYQVLEGNPVTVTVQRAGPKLGGGATVSWAVVGGTATPGADFEPSSGTLTFDPGVTQRTLIISTARDRLAEGNETIVLGLSGARLDVPSTTRIVIQDDDVGGTIQLAPGPLRVFENAGPALVTVTRSGGTAEAVTVDYEASGLTARPGVDFTAVFGTLTFAADVTSLTFAVPLVDTTLAEGDRTVRLVLRNPGGGATLGALRETVLTILDDEVGVRFDAPAYTVAENAGGITITVLRTGPTTGVSTVNYSTSDGTAQAGADYTATAGRLTFQPGDKSKTFRVPILEDQIVEDIETIVVVLSNPTGAVLGPVNAAVVAITDNDKGGVVQFATPTLSVSESQPNATLQVTRTGGMATAVKVDYLATDGSARSGQDYAETSGTLTFAAGERSKTILVPLLSDRRVEPNETFTVTLSNPTGGATLGTPAQVVVTINSSDAGGVIRFSSASYRVDEPNSLGTPVTITVTRSGTNLAGGVSVQYATSDGTAVAPADYFASAGQLVFGPGETVKTFEIVVRGDGALESDETVTITLSDPQGGARLGTPSVATLTIVDSGTSVRFERSEYVVEERAGAVTLAVVRSGPSGDTLKVGYATADIPDGEPPAGHAVAGTHYRATSGTLTFRPGDSRKPLSVPIVLDPAAGNPKAFRVLLTPPSGLSQDLDRTALVTILDSARPGVVQFASAASTVREGASVAIAVTRSEGLDGTVVVSWSATGGTATAGADFTPASGVLTFSPGASSRTITIAAVNDTLAEGDETVTLQLSGVTGNASLGPRATHTLTIQDDDTAGTIELSAPSYSAAEGASAVITVVRRGGLASGVTVDFTTEDMGVGPGVAVENSDYAKITRTLTFGAKETTKTVSIALTPDAEPESDETFRVRLSNPQPALATLGPQTTAVVTIQDRQSRLAFRDPVVRVTEGQSATITVTRTGPLLGQVTVGYRAAGGSAVEDIDYSLPPGTLTFPPNTASMRFTIATTGNGVVDGTRTVALQLFDAVGASLGLATAELRIDDDERPGAIQFAQPAFTIVEGGVAEIVLARTGGAAGSVTVQCEVAGGSATGGGVDYTLDPGTLTFAPGVTTATLLVPTVADLLPEGTERVILRLTAVTGGATLGPVATATLFIVDREQTAAFSSDSFTVGETEAAAAITVVRAGLPNGTLTVTARTVEATGPGVAVPGLDYQSTTTPLTFAPGEIVKTFLVPIPDTALVRSGNRTVQLALEGDPGLIVMPSAATLTILDFQPDLIVPTVAPPSSALSGKLVSAPLSVRNIGRVASPPFQVGIYLSFDDKTTEAALPGAGEELPSVNVRALQPGETVQIGLMIDIDDQRRAGNYFVSAIADFGRLVSESDETNNGRASSTASLRIFRNFGKLTSATASLSQGDVAASPLTLGARPVGVGSSCDARGDNIALTGSFQIVTQIDSFAEATARLTGTLNDQPVQYEVDLGLTIDDNNKVSGSFKVTKVSGAFATDSNQNSGTFEGTLDGRVLSGNMAGTISTTTGGVCAFAGTLNASGDTSFFIGLQERALGGQFLVGSLTPTLGLPAAVAEYLAEFRVLFDTNVPAPATVTFTGPAGSGLVAAPASGRRSDVDAGGVTATYRSAPVPRPGGGPGGDWTVSYRGAPQVLEVSPPVTDRRLVLAIPTAQVDPTGLLTAVTLSWTDRTGVPMDPPAFVTRVRIVFESHTGPGPLYLSPEMSRGNTSHTLTMPVLWEDVAEVAMLYQDSATGHEYRVAYPRTPRAFVELATEHRVDKTGTIDGQFVTLSFVAPAGLVDPDTVGAVRATGVTLVDTPVPFAGRTLEDGQEFDVFRLRLDAGSALLTEGTPVVFTVTPLAGSIRQLVTSLHNRPTNQSIQITNGFGTSEADAMLGVRREITWTLPPPAAAGGFDVAAVSLSGTVTTPDGRRFCSAVTDRELGPDATSGFVTLPLTCAGQPVESASVCVTVQGDGGEQATACHTFGPDDIVLRFGGKSASTTAVVEGSVASITVNRIGPARRSVSVDFATVPGGRAVAGVDYDETSGTLTFPAGNSVQTFTVNTRGNNLATGPRDVRLELRNPSRGARIDPKLGQTALTILDDDQAGTVTFLAPSFTVTEGQEIKLPVTRTGANRAGNVSVDYVIVGGTAVPGLDFTLSSAQPTSGQLTFSVGQASAAIVVRALQDTLARGARTLIVQLVNPLGGASIGTQAQTTLTINDDDQGGVVQFKTTSLKITEGTTLGRLAVIRDGKNLAGNVTVDYQVAAGTTAVAGRDYVLANGTLTFGVGQGGAEVQVQFLDDAIADGFRTLVIELVNPRGGATLGPLTRSTVTIADDEQEIQFLQTAVSVPEGMAFSLTVTRTGPLPAGTTVHYRTVAGTAGAGDFLPVPDSTITFGEGSRSETIVLRTVQDSLPEGDETFFVELHTPAPGAVLGLNSRATITIVDDEPTVRFDRASYSVVEGGTVNVVVTRTPTTGTVTVRVGDVPGGTATRGLDYSPVDLPLVFAPGQGSVTFPVRAFDNTLDEPNKTLLLRLSLPSPGLTIVGGGQAVVTIGDDEQGGLIGFASAAVTASEAGRSSGFTVSRSKGKTADRLAGSVLVDYAVVAGTAVAGRDYLLSNGTLTSGTLTFLVDETQKTIPVTLIDNALADHDRTLTLELSNPRGGGVLTSLTRSTMTIVDDEDEIQFTASSFSVSEGTEATITAARRGPAKTTATVKYAALPGTASSGDFKPISGTLTFGPGATSAKFAIPTASDTLTEGNETILLELSAPSPGAALGPLFRATLVIVDDDQGGTVQFASSTAGVVEGQPGALVVTRTGTNLGGGVVVGYQAVAGGTAVNDGVDFTLPPGTLTFGAGETSKTITVPTVDNTVVNGARTVIVRLVSFTPAGLVVPGSVLQTTLTILDNDEGGVVQFAAAAVSTSELRVSTAPIGFPGVGKPVPLSIQITREGKNLAGGVTVDYRIAGGTAVPDTDFSFSNGTLTFTAGQASASISLLPLNNQIADGNRTVVLDLLRPQGGAQLGKPSRMTVTIVDDEQEVQFSASGYAVTEGGNAIITVTRTGPTTGIATVDFATVAGGNAVAGVDYVSTSGTLTFDVGVSSVSFTVTTIDDKLFKGDRTLTLQLSNPTDSAPASAILLGPRSQATLTIADNEQRLRFATPSVSVTEGSVASLLVVRDGPSDGTISVKYATIPGTASADVDYTSVSGELVFPPGVTSQAIQVLTRRDFGNEPSETLSVQISAPSPGVVLGTPSSAVVTILNGPVILIPR